MSLSPIVRTVALAVPVLASSLASAAYLSFTDRAAFNAALAGNSVSQTATFNAATPGAATSVTDGQVTVYADTSYVPGSAVTPFPALNPITVNSAGTLSLPVGLIFFSPIFGYNEAPTLAVGPLGASTLTGFGFDVTGATNTGRYLLRVSGQEFRVPGTATFFGVVATGTDSIAVSSQGVITSFQSSPISVPNTEFSGTLTIDNLTIVTVPEPTSASLLALVLPLALRRKR